MQNHEPGDGGPASDGLAPAMAIVSTFVLGGLEPLRVVVHYDDGTWSFSCGTAVEADHFVTMHAEHMFSRFGYDLFHLRGLRKAYMAEREAPGDEWVISPYEED